MGKKLEQSYYEEIVRFIKKATGYNLSLSPKDRQLIQKMAEKEIPVETVKELIKKELSRYPPDKRKKFRLSAIEPALKKLAKPRTVEKSPQTDSLPDEFSDAYHRLEMLNRIWKSLPEEEKKEIIRTAVKRMKERFILQNINQKKVIKSIIREILTERYNI
ncbi:MAG: hypothetical protein GXN94_02855 [Aquificae bacterium]|nr:hypothetical protein [Aquificota bacterium]